MKKLFLLQIASILCSCTVIKPPNGWNATIAADQTGLVTGYAGVSGELHLENVPIIGRLFRQN